MSLVDHFRVGNKHVEEKKRNFYNCQFPLAFWLSSLAPRDITLGGNTYAFGNIEAQVSKSSRSSYKNDNKSNHMPIIVQTHLLGPATIEGFQATTETDATLGTHQSA